jgi:hypothetical protein
VRLKIWTTQEWQVLTDDGNWITLHDQGEPEAIAEAKRFGTNKYRLVSITNEIVEYDV